MIKSAGNSLLYDLERANIGNTSQQTHESLHCRFRSQVCRMLTSQTGYKEVNYVLGIVNML